MEGRSYPGNFVIADIKTKINLPTERLCFFLILRGIQATTSWCTDSRMISGGLQTRCWRRGVIYDITNKRYPMSGLVRYFLRQHRPRSYSKTEHLPLYVK
jgi:hypothetical protein